MPALSFQKRFVPAVEVGDKTHSIRGYRKRPFVVGDKLALYYAMRTKQCRLLFRTVVTKVEDIVIREAGASVVCASDGAEETAVTVHLRIAVDGVELAKDEREALAQRDGFASVHAMGVWWLNNNDLPFRGQIIHWQYIVPSYKRGN